MFHTTSTRKEKDNMVPRKQNTEIKQVNVLAEVEPFGDKTIRYYGLISYSF